FLPRPPAGPPGARAGAGARRAARSSRRCGARREVGVAGKDVLGRLLQAPPVRLVRRVVSVHFFLGAACAPAWPRRARALMAAVARRRGLATPRRQPWAELRGGVPATPC